MTPNNNNNIFLDGKTGKLSYSKIIIKKTVFILFELPFSYLNFKFDM